MPLLCLSSGPQLTETNSFVMISCEISSKSFSPIGWGRFLWPLLTGLRSEDEASQHEDPRGVVPTRFYSSTKAMMTGWPLSSDSNWRAPGVKISVTVLDSLVYLLQGEIQLLNPHKNADPAVFSPPFFTSDGTLDKKGQKTQHWSFSMLTRCSWFILSELKCLVCQPSECD